MKKLIILLCLVFSVSAQADKWVDDWFDNAVYDKGNSYSGQKRGYYSAGSFSARVNSSTEYPVTVSAPKLSIGCGGIDAFAGGLSFLDAEYLVEKVQGVMQASPFIALDMAMKTMCKECSETLAKAEQIANFLNGIQLNECALAKPLVASIAEGDPETLKQGWAEATGAKEAYDGISDLWTKSKEDISANDNRPTQDLKSEIRACPKEFKELMANGSLVFKITKKTGMEDYTDMLRGYLGDVIIKATPTDKVVTSIEIVGCPQNKDQSLDDMLNGKMYTKDDNGVCTLSTQKSVVSVVEGKLIDLVAKIKVGQALTPTEESFIFASPNLPVYSILRQSVISKTTSEDISLLKEVIAVHYTYMIYEDLFRNVTYALKSASSAISTPTNDPTASSNDRCNTNLYSGAISKFKNLIANNKDRREALAVQYGLLLQDKTRSAAFSRLFKERENETRTRNAVWEVQ